MKDSTILQKTEEHASEGLSLNSPEVPLTRRTSLLTKLFKVEWDKHFPFNIPDCDCTIAYIGPELAFQFIRESYGEIFELELWKNPFLAEQQTEAKLQYYRECGDFFMIYKKSQPIGIFIGTLTDWSSYYFRSAAVLPQHQGNGAIARLLPYLTKILTDSGIARIESDASVSNFTSIQILLRARFKVTGMQLSERWGALLHFTKFLSPSSEKIFVGQFCPESNLT
ncbi:MAG: GNAT family N-acetyltransferase [Bdellovibrionia bacterium]